VIVIVTAFWTRRSGEEGYEIVGPEGGGTHTPRLTLILVTNTRPMADHVPAKQTVQHAVRSRI